VITAAAGTTNLDPQEFPTGDLLDRAAPKHPVAPAASTATTWAAPEALKRAGVTKATLIRRAGASSTTRKASPRASSSTPQRSSSSSRSRPSQPRRARG
jgi:predicted amidohydrolase YtcJ